MTSSDDDDFDDVASRTTALFTSILDAIPPDVSLDEAVAATLTAYVVMAHESQFTIDQAIDALRQHWDAGERLRDGIVAHAKREGSR